MQSPNNRLQFSQRKKDNLNHRLLLLLFAILSVCYRIFEPLILTLDSEIFAINHETGNATRTQFRRAQIPFSASNLNLTQNTSHEEQKNSFRVRNKENFSVREVENGQRDTDKNS